MKNLVLENKAGFYSLFPFVIYEINGNVFYSSDFTDKIEKGKPLYFNLPAGQYLYEGSLTKLDNPVKTIKIELPPPERNLQKKRYEIIFGINPNRCTIYYKAGIILFDNAFKEAPLYIKYEIYFHELGHHFYKTEKFADLYAAKKMLDLGFNPSQIGRTSLITLRSDKIDRKKYVIDRLTNDES